MYSAQAMSMSSSAAGASSSYGGANAGSQSGMAKNVQSMAQNNNSSAASVSSPGAKKEGVLRVGMANVKTGSVGEGMNAAELSAAIRNSLTEYLKTPKVELVALEAKLPSAIIDEAKDKQCDYVIYATVSHKKGGGGGFGGMFGKVLAPVLSSTGMGGGMAGAIAGQAASTAIMSASQASANVKSKDELTLDIKLSAVADSSAALAKQYKGKANSDGEDVISPLIEQAAQAILDAMKR
jgi:hypothetical protein